jgi:hypothetical protein
MVATDQENEQLGLMQAIFSKMSDKDKAKLQGMGQAAAGYNANAMSNQMAPVQFGGGLLQMLPAPQMQYGQGMMGNVRPQQGPVERDAEFVQAMKALLGFNQ